MKTATKQYIVSGTLGCIMGLVISKIVQNTFISISITIPLAVILGWWIVKLWR